MKERKIKLGDKVIDKITGYTGIATARTEFLNGCVQYSIARKLKKDQEINVAGDPSIDEMCLEVVKERVINSKEYEDEDDEIMSVHPEPFEIKNRNGGPTRFMKGMRGY